MLTKSKFKILAGTHDVFYPKYFLSFCPLKQSGNNDQLVSKAQPYNPFVSFKYHFSQRELSLLGEIADSRSAAGNLQNVPSTFVIADSKEVIKNYCGYIKDSEANRKRLSQAKDGKF